MTNLEFPYRMDDKTRAFLNELVASGVPPLEQQSVADARRGAAALQRMPVASPPAEFEERSIPVGPSGQISITVVRPGGQRGVLPVLLYFHGGGWVLYDFAAYRHLLSEIAVGADAAVVFVDYSLSPEVRYPVAVDECFAATRWIAEHGDELQLDVAHLAVGGDSAGGNLAAAVTLLANERGGPRIDFQLLLYPVADANFETSTYREFAVEPFLTRAAMIWFWDHYAPDLAVRSEPTASPLRASIDRLRNLPPALVLTAELDPLRDEGESYARRLTEAGVPVAAVRYVGAIHGFMSLHALADTPTARAAIAHATATLRKALAK